LPVNIWVNPTLDALTLAYATEHFKIGYSICFSGADEVKEQTSRSKNIMWDLGKSVKSFQILDYTATGQRRQEILGHRVIM